MPTYEYKCLECDERFELFQNMTDDPVTTCPSCKGRVKRLIGSGAGIIFKGSGFYATDYRSESYRQGVKSEKKPSTTEPKSDKGGDGTSKGGDSAGKGETKTSSASASSRS